MPTSEVNPVFQGKQLRDLFPNCSYMQEKLLHNNTILPHSAVNSLHASWIWGPGEKCWHPLVRGTSSQRLGVLMFEVPKNHGWHSPSRFFYHHIQLPKLCQGSGRCCLAEHMPKLVLENSSPTTDSNFKSSWRKRQEGRSWGSRGDRKNSHAHLPVNDALALQEEQTDGNLCSIESEIKREWWWRNSRTSYAWQLSEVDVILNKAQGMESLLWMASCTTQKLLSTWVGEQDSSEWQTTVGERSAIA